MARKPPAAPKLCERCEAFFPSIASDTCPQCFAPLTKLTEEQAVKAAEVQVERLKDPKYVERKVEEDERFKEQSFGACLGVLGLLAGVIVLSIILIAATARWRHSVFMPSTITNVQFGANQSDSLLPPLLDGLTRGAVMSEPVPNSQQPIYHAFYDQQIQLYVLSTNPLSTSSLNGLRQVVSAVCHQTMPPLISQEVHTKLAYYDIIGSNGGLVGNAAEQLLQQYK